MFLKPENSECRDIHQKIIVSKEPRENREHRAVNPNGMYEVRHYRLDGKLITNQTCCDFLLLNDTRKKEYAYNLRNLKDRYGVNRVLCKTRLIEETLD